MLLVIDVGNTTTVVGIFDDDSEGKLIAHWRLSSILHTPDELGIYILNLLSTQNIKANEIHGAAFASVVPPLNFSIREAVKKYFHELSVRSELTALSMQLRAARSTERRSS